MHTDTSGRCVDNMVLGNLSGRFLLGNRSASLSRLISDYSGNSSTSNTTLYRTPPHAGNLCDWLPANDPGRAIFCPVSGELPIPFNYEDCQSNYISSRIPANPLIPSNPIPIDPNRLYQSCSNRGEQAYDHLRRMRQGWTVEVYGYQTSGPSLYHAFILLRDWQNPSIYGYAAGPTNLTGLGGLIAQFIDNPEAEFGVIEVTCSDPSLGCELFTDDGEYDERGGPRLVIAAMNNNVDEIKNCLDSEANRIVNMRRIYLAQGPNSNTFVSTLLRKCGLPNINPVGNISLTHNFPGWDNRDLD